VSVAGLSSSLLDKTRKVPVTSLRGLIKQWDFSNQPQALHASFRVLQRQSNWVKYAGSVNHSNQMATHFHVNSREVYESREMEEAVVKRLVKMYVSKLSKWVNLPRQKLPPRSISMISFKFLPSFGLG